MGLLSFFKMSVRKSEINNTPMSTEENILNIQPSFELENGDAISQKKSDTQEHKNNVVSFLGKNFNVMGISDGFEYHTFDLLEIGKKKILTEFQLTLDIEIQHKIDSLLKMKHLLVDVKEISAAAKEKLELTIEELNASVQLLQTQQELSALEEGWVMNAIHAYHQGFIQGLNDYIEGEQFLHSVKNF